MPKSSRLERQPVFARIASCSRAWGLAGTEEGAGERDLTEPSAHPADLVFPTASSQSTPRMRRMQSSSQIGLRWNGRGTATEPSRVLKNGAVNKQTQTSPFRAAG